MRTRFCNSIPVNQSVCPISGVGVRWKCPVLFLEAQISASCRRTLCTEGSWLSKRRIGQPCCCILNASYCIFFNQLVPSNIRWAREGLWLWIWMFLQVCPCISANHIVQRRIQRLFSELLTMLGPGCRPAIAPSFKCISPFLRLFFCHQCSGRKSKRGQENDGKNKEF